MATQTCTGSDPGRGHSGIGAHPRVRARRQMIAERGMMISMPGAITGCRSGS
jgi:hypothetical protein